MKKRCKFAIRNSKGCTGYTCWTYSKEDRLKHNISTPCEVTDGYENHECIGYQKGNKTLNRKLALKEIEEL